MCEEIELQGKKKKKCGCAIMAIRWWKKKKSVYHVIFGIMMIKGK